MAAWMRPWLSNASASRGPMTGKLVQLEGSSSALVTVTSAVCPALLALYAVFGLCLGNAPMQDLPDHMTRAHIIADLIFGHGAQFGNHFLLQPSFSPYIAGDLLLATVDRLLGTAWTCRLCIAASIVLLPLAVRFVVRQQGGGQVAASIAAVLALYVATDSMFTMGFANFTFSVACTLFAYGWFCNAAHAPGRRAYAWFVLLLLLSYAIHLSALIFIIALAGISCALGVWNGQMSLKRAAALLLPAFLLLLFQIALSPGTNIHGDYEWGTWVSKLSWFAFQACRFRLAIDLPLLMAFAAAAAFPIAMSWLRGTVVAGEQLLITAALALVYLITPYQVGVVTYLDMRALHYASLFLICAGVRYAEVGPKMLATQLAAASTVAVLNLLYLATSMLPQDAALGDYRRLAREIPADAKVLPIDTRAPLQGSHRYYDPFRHAGAYATLESHALTPYLFAGDLQPHLAYFRYRDRRPYAPEEIWYVEPVRWKGAHVDWQRVVRVYRYLLVTVPWDAQKLPVSYTVIAQNDAAALLELDDRSPAPAR
jgi:hypothetical protein